MTDLIYDYITMGVDMMISAAILTAVVILMRSSTILSSYSAQMQANSDRINYYKEYSTYDCTDNLLSPDALSAMVYYRFDLEVVIKIDSNIYYNDTNTGNYYVNDVSAGTTTQIDYATLSSAVGSSRTFKAYLCEDFTDEKSTSGYQGGLVTGLYFEKY